MPITAHTNGGTTRFMREGPVYQYSKTPARVIPGRDPISLLFRFSNDNPIAPLQLAFTGLFDRFPKLQIYWSETQAGWLAYSWRRSTTTMRATVTGLSEIGA